MSFELFRMIYLLLSIAMASTITWKLRKSSEDVLATATLTLLVFSILFAVYLDSGKHAPRDDISEFIFRSFTHTKGDIILVFCNSLLWGAVPFAIGMVLRKKSHSGWWVCGFFTILLLAKTQFEDFFFIHLYPQLAQLPPYHTFEWQYVMVGWGVVYSLASIAIVKGTRLFTTNT